MKALFQFIRIYMLPHWRLFCLAVLTGLVAAGASGLGLPFAIYAVFPIIFNGPDAAHEFLRPYISGMDHSTILLLSCMMLPAMFTIRGLGLWLNAVIVNILSVRVLEGIRLSVFTRIQDLPIAFLDKQNKGDLLSRIVSDTQNVQSAISHTSNEIIKQPITTISALTAFFFLIFQNGNAGDFIINLLFVAVAIYPIIVFGKRIAKRSHQAQSDLGEMNTILQQNLETQREIRAYSLESRQIADFTDVTNTYGQKTVKMVRYQRALVPIMELVTAIALAVLLAQGKMRGMMLSDFLALATALYMAFNSMSRAGRAFNSINSAQGALKRLREILDAPTSIQDPSSPKHWNAPVEGHIRFDQVSFSYNEKKQALKKIQLDIPAGQIVGLVGPSGAGKTSFVNLIERFYEVNEGSISIDGIDVRQVTQKNLRDKIAYVGQQALLFSGSIRENIALGKPDASDEDVLRAAQQSSLSDFLSQSSLGLDTEVGEGGKEVSGGQRQRVAIARAFIKDASILILDEATASLDAKSEREIQEALDKLAQGRTTLIVAHRFSTLRHAQRILVFDQGSIVGDGSHEELYASCELYRELHDKQSIS